MFQGSRLKNTTCILGYLLVIFQVFLLDYKRFYSLPVVFVFFIIFKKFNLT